MHKHQGQQSAVHIRLDILRSVGDWDPFGRSYAFKNSLVKRIYDRIGVRLEEAIIDLSENITYGLGFLGQSDRKERFKVGNQLRHQVGLKSS